MTEKDNSDSVKSTYCAIKRGASPLSSFYVQLRGDVDGREVTEEIGFSYGYNTKVRHVSGKIEISNVAGLITIEGDNLRSIFLALLSHKLEWVRVWRDSDKYSDDEARPHTITIDESE